MQRPTIFFCPANKAEELSSAILSPILKPNPDRIGFFLDALRGEIPIIVTDDPACLTGWEAPHDTLMVFIEGFPTEGPARVQAEARVRRLDPA